MQKLFHLLLFKSLDVILVKYLNEDKDALSWVVRMKERLYRGEKEGEVMVEIKRAWWIKTMDKYEPFNYLIKPEPFNF